MRVSKIYRIIFILPSKIKRIFHRSLAVPIIRHSFGKCGKNVRISTNCKFSGIENIYAGNNIVLGK